MNNFNVTGNVFFQPLFNITNAALLPNPVGIEKRVFSPVDNKPVKTIEKKKHTNDKTNQKAQEVLKNTGSKHHSRSNHTKKTSQRPNHNGVKKTSSDEKINALEKRIKALEAQNKDLVDASKKEKELSDSKFTILTKDFDLLRAVSSSQKSQLVASQREVKELVNNRVFLEVENEKNQKNCQKYKEEIEALASEVSNLHKLKEENKQLLTDNNECYALMEEVKGNAKAVVEEQVKLKKAYAKLKKEYDQWN
jgi:chromosome segregation ATPase